MYPEFDDFFAARQLMYRAGASGGVASALRDWGVEPGRVFVVADKIVGDLGGLEALKRGFAEQGFEVEVFAEIAGEPNDDIVERATAAARAYGPQVIVGVGGGSALDSAKLVNYLTVSGRALSEIAGPIPSLDGFLPMALVPTTVGTGSEATRVAMFSVQGMKRAVVCRQFLPIVAALDTDLVAQLPPFVVAPTALDALSHAIESMQSKNRNAFTMLVGGEAARIIFRRLRAAVLENDAEAKGELLYASYLAGVALNAGVVLGHSLSYVVASRQGLSHGAGCALALPYTIAYNHAVDPELNRKIAELVTGDPDADLQQLALDIAELTREVSLPTSTGETGLDASRIPELVHEVIESFPRPNNPVEITEERLTRLLEHMQTGDVAAAWAAMNSEEA
ncbi:iron-containing alcohol dehydrogenase family protein [Leucobacter ruminantium]|uniref:Iron-containing alcohol dehydrogenase n=1 Tax=Leucobacter ruminantium TaxID=1289170 RepID=A0A939RYP7_9MICO|nr:iron-containing alcohol dehydrogenase [Leucobacter ruminantium]MBO1805086.1 iron-containing alcohol dehydrogenase [Leucobacter ruminantium]